MGTQCWPQQSHWGAATVSQSYPRHPASDHIHTNTYTTHTHTHTGSCVLLRDWNSFLKSRSFPETCGMNILLTGAWQSSFPLILALILLQIRFQFPPECRSGIRTVFQRLQRPLFWSRIDWKNCACLGLIIPELALVVPCYFFRLRFYALKVKRLYCELDLFWNFCSKSSSVKF